MAVYSALLTHRYPKLYARGTSKGPRRRTSEEGKTSRRQTSERWARARDTQLSLESRLRQRKDRERRTRVELETIEVDNTTEVCTGKLLVFIPGPAQPSGKPVLRWRFTWSPAASFSRVLKCLDCRPCFRMTASDVRALG